LLLLFIHVSRILHDSLAKQAVMRDTPTQKQSTSRAKSRWSDYISDLAWSRLLVESAELCEIAGDQARNQLGTTGGTKSFLREAQIFELCPIYFRLCPTHFSRGSKNFL